MIPPAAQAFVHRRMDRFVPGKVWAARVMMSFPAAQAFVHRMDRLASNWAEYPTCHWTSLAIREGLAQGLKAVEAAKAAAALVHHSIQVEPNLLGSVQSRAPDSCFLKEDLAVATYLDFLVASLQAGVGLNSELEVQAPT